MGQVCIRFQGFTVVVLVNSYHSNATAKNFLVFLLNFFHDVSSRLAHSHRKPSSWLKTRIPDHSPAKHRITPALPFLVASCKAFRYSLSAQDTKDSKICSG